MGYTNFVEAETGQVVLTAVERGGLKRVITDWNMPVMNGLEFVNALCESWPDLPILMFTPDTLSEKVLSVLT